MKKVISLFVVGLFLMTAVSCSSVESKAESYINKIEKAREADDYQKVLEISAEMDKWYENLSEADKKKAEKVAAEYLKNALGDFDF